MAPAASQTCRDIYDGPPSKVTEIIAPHVCKADWIAYSDKFDSKVEPNKILPLKELFRLLRKVQRNLSFKQTTMQECMVQVEQEKSASWPRLLRDDEKDDWTRTCATRLRAMCRGISQTELKSPKAAWLAELWGVQGDSQEEAYLFGFAKDTGLAWRARAGHTKSKEFSESLFVNDDSEFLQAKFADGAVVELPDLTKNQWEEMEKASATTRPDTCYRWRCKHKTTGKEYSIAKKRDRVRTLICIFGMDEDCNKRQLVSVADTDFEGCLDKAFALAKGLLEELCAGDFEEKLLKAKRDEKLGRTKALKRPAAAAAEQDEQADQAEQAEQTKPLRKRPAVAAAAASIRCNDDDDDLSDLNDDPPPIF